MLKSFQFSIDYIILTARPTTTTRPPTTTTPKRDEGYDVVIVMDSSVPDETYRWMKGFVRSIAESFSIDDEEYKVGLLRYSTSPRKVQYFQLTAEPIRRVYASSANPLSHGLYEIFESGVCFIWLTLNRRKKMCIPRHKNELFKRSLQYSGAIIWNTIPLHIKESSTLQIFKNNPSKYNIWKR